MSFVSCSSASPALRSQAKQLLSSPLESCYSHLMDANGQGVHSLILSLVGLKVSAHVHQLMTHAAQLVTQELSGLIRASLPVTPLLAGCNPQCYI